MSLLRVFFGFWLFGGALFAQTVVDALGRSVEVGEVKRVAALYSTMRFVTYLGAEDLAVVTENIEKREIESRPYSQKAHKHLAKLPSVGEGGAGKPINLELLALARADVIFVSFVDAKTADNISEKTKTPVVVLNYGKGGFEPKGFLDSLRIAAKLLKKESRYEELASYIWALEGELSQMGKKRKLTPKIYLGALSYKGAHGIGSTEGYVAGAAALGLTNIASLKSPFGHLFLDKEFILKSEPDYLYIDAAGLENVAMEYGRERAFFEHLKAIKNSNSYRILPNLFYAYNVETIYLNSFFYAKTALGVSIDIEKKAKEIYTKFVGIDAYPLLKKRYGGYGKIRFEGGRISAEELK